MWLFNHLVVSVRAWVSSQEGCHCYIFLIYGMYHCLNITTRSEGQPCAILIRAVEPLEGSDQMAQNRRRNSTSSKSSSDSCRSADSRPPKPMKLQLLCSGPGRLCQAFQVCRSLRTRPVGEICVGALPQPNPPE